MIISFVITSAKGGGSYDIPAVGLSLCLSVCLSICLFVRLSVRPSVWLAGWLQSFKIGMKLNNCSPSEPRILAVLVNTLRPRQDGRHFPDDIFIKFIPKGTINNIPALVQITSWCRPDDKPLSEQWWWIYQRICVTRPQWVLRLSRLLHIPQTHPWRQCELCECFWMVHAKWLLS